MKHLLPNGKKGHAVRNAGARLTHFATRLFDTPLLIHPQKLETILAVLGPHLGLNTGLVLPMENEPDEPEEDDASAALEFTGVGIVPVYGTLVKRSTGMNAASGLTSYGQLQGAVAAAMADPNCSALVLDIDSPGGEASGMFDFVKFLTAFRGQKPIIGVANDSAYSAAYCIASACDQLLVTSDGGVGSIGCYMLHCDQSGYDKSKGLDYTYIFSGDHKVEGNPHEPLSDAARANFQSDVDRIRDLFVASVAKSRKVDQQKIYDTQAACFTGADGCPLLADGVGTLEDAIGLAERASKGSRSFFMPSQEGGTALSVAPEQQVRSAIDDWARLTGTPGMSKWMDHTFADSTIILAFRASGPATAMEAAGSAGQRITGLVAPYESLSCDLGNFKEIYQRGCFQESLTGDDPRVLFNHNADCVLGRQSAGTARFWEESDGLHYEADAPDTQWARDLQTSMARGDIRESSAAFYIMQHRWEQRGATRVRIIEKAKLVEGGPHSFAAYGASTAAVNEPESHAAAEAESLSVIAARNELELIGARLQLLRVQ